MPNQYVGPCHLAGRTALGFTENIVTNDCRARPIGHVRQHWTCPLMLDLQVVPLGVDNQVMFDQPGYKWRPPIRIPEVQAGSSAFDHAVANHPAPGRTSGRNCNCLLIIAMSEDMESIQNDVVRPIGVPLAFQSIHRQVAAIEIEIPKCDVTGIDDTDRIMP